MRAGQTFPLELSNTMSLSWIQAGTLSSTTAAVQMSGFLLQFWVPRNTLVITYAYDMR